MDNFILYQPNPTKQILLHDAATSSSVCTYLKMNNFSSRFENKTNAEFMSENGRLPVVVEKDSDKLMCGFTEVFWHVSRKLNRMPSLLELAYMDWVESKFLEAEMYICWCYEPVLLKYTRPRYTYDLPFPVASILFNRKKTQIQEIVGKKFKDFDDFLRRFEHFLTQLNKRIGAKSYCLSETDPSCVDALIYGHTKAIKTISLELPPKFVAALTKQRRIMHLTDDRIEKDYPS